MKTLKLTKLSVLMSSLLAAGSIMAQTVNVGVSVSATGPAASLGIHERNTVEIVPTKVGDVEVKYFVLDDATDTAQAVRNMRKLISEQNIDVMVGSTVTPGSLGMVDVGAEMKVPVISLAGNAVVVEPQEGAKIWAFKTPQNDALMASAIRKNMEKQGIKRVGYIGFADAYGTGWLTELEKALEGSGIEVVAKESFARSDTSVTGQVMKLISAKPDAVLIGTAGTPGALPQRELIQRGFKGVTYHTHGSANNDFLRVCGNACEGVILPVGPVVVAEQLDDSHPSKAGGVEYIKLYNDKFGEGTVNSFGAHMWDASVLINSAIPHALESGAKPGTEEFRAAMRDALENHKDVLGVHGVFNTSKDNHTGLDERARVVIKVQDGKWVYDPDLE
ncbi:MAG: ABC transporter substrate-binding protein [Alcaligenaceae bacterium]|nr:ABC transporter substrate-binding protein [Alcaligenaceae bacterium]